MMNRTKSSKRQLLRLLFLLPPTVILLLAFRNKIDESGQLNISKNNLIAIGQQRIVFDTIPGEDFPNDYKNFLKRNSEVKSAHWNRNPFSITINFKNGSKETYNLENKSEVAIAEEKYGKLPQAPPPPPPPPPPPTNVEEVTGLSDFLKRNPEIEKVGYVFNRDNTVAIYHLFKKNAIEEIIDMRKEDDRKKGEDKYGKFPVPSKTLGYP